MDTCYEEAARKIWSAGIDYGAGMTNCDADTGIRYGVIHAGEVGPAWYDSSEPDYGAASCPECGGEAVEYDEDAHGAWPYYSYKDADYACPDCKHVFGPESAFPESPHAFILDDGEYVAQQGGDDSDIFITRAPYFTYCKFCSPCAPGAGYLLDSLPKGKGIKAYCFGHDWFEGGVAPYEVYRVSNGRRVNPKKAG